jgi:hypothetical protein
MLTTTITKSTTTTSSNSSNSSSSSCSSELSESTKEENDVNNNIITTNPISSSRDDDDDESEKLNNNLQHWQRWPSSYVKAAFAFIRDGDDISLLEECLNDLTDRPSARFSPDEIFHDVPALRVFERALAKAWEVTKSKKMPPSRGLHTMIDYFAEKMHTDDIRKISVSTIELCKDMALPKWTCLHPLWTILFAPQAIIVLDRCSRGVSFPAAMTGAIGRHLRHVELSCYCRMMQQQQQKSQQHLQQPQPPQLFNLDDDELTQEQHHHQQQDDNDELLLLLEEENQIIIPPQYSNPLHMLKPQPDEHRPGQLRAFCNRVGCSRVRSEFDNEEHHWGGKCSQCNMVEYCSLPCQYSDWKFRHKDECQNNKC